MKRIALIALLVFVGCEGKQGPVGPAGKSGESLHTKAYTGVLYPTQLKEFSTEVNKFWEITVSLTENSLVGVYVRQGSGYLWRSPTWMLSNNGYVRIYDDALVEQNWEYKIIVSR